jgi:hypothetical protein
MQSVYRLVKAMLTNSLDGLEDLLDCDGIAFRKPSGGVRPIAIGEVLYRIASKCALAMVEDAAISLAPLQHAYAVHGGPAIVGQALQAALEAHPDAVLLSADFHNAFNTLSRRSIQHALLTHCPFLAPFFMFSYAQPSKVFFRGMNPGEYLQFTTGVKQGDPLATFLFCITLQDGLRTASQASPDAHIIGFADDIHVVGSADGAQLVFTSLLQQAHDRALTPSLHKCAAYSANPDFSHAVAQSLGIQHAADGVVACGTPIGTPTFVKQFVAAKAQHATSLINRLTELPISAQCKWLILQRSLQRKLNHLKFTVPWHLLQQPLQAFQHSVTMAALSILDLPRPASRHLNPDYVNIQLRLPLRQGGFGLDYTTKEVATAAWLSMAARCDIALAQGPALFRPLTGEGPELEALWHSVLAYAPRVCPPDTPNPQHVAPGILPHIVQCPKITAHVYAESQYTHLRHQLSSPEHRARLLSIACRTSGAFLDTLPTCNRLTLSNSEFIDSCQFRLGASGFVSDAPPATCYCGAQLQGNDASHAMSCRRMPSSNQHYRHNIVTEAIRNVASRAGLSSTREPLYRELDPAGHASGNARGDVYAIINPGPGPTAVDTVVTHPGSVTALGKGSADTRGAAAAEARRRKNSAFAAHRVQGLTFYAFAIESYGFVDKDGMELLRALARAASSTGHVTFGGFLASVHREVSVALCKGNHAIFRAGVQMYTRASGHARIDGHLIPTADIE